MAFTPSLSPPEALGESRAFLDFQDRLRQAAPVERPVLLLGERGTGKEMAARRMHFLSHRWGQPLVTLNCAALSPSLIESELFGHEAGAFTGAARRRVGRFEQAHEGTLFLDEISLIPQETQEKILRVVEYGVFERVGSTDPIEVDVRILGASNANLLRLAEQGRFKRDLLDRLSFEVLFLPPLRDREEDILLLARHFAARMAHELGRGAMPGFSDAALRRLMEYDWPGNVRELKNVVERAVYRCDTETISRLEFNPFAHAWLRPESVDAADRVTRPVASQRSNLLERMQESEAFSLPEYLACLEREALQEALEMSQYHQKRAAQILGLSYHQFRGLYRKHKEALEQASVDMKPSG